MADNLADTLLGLTQKQLDALPAELREEIETARKQVLAAQRLQSLQAAKDDLLTFTRGTMPDPMFPDDATKSRYEVHKVHQFLADALMKVERGEILRLALSVQPRVGKSQLSSRSFPSWVWGRDPYKQMIITSYGDTLAREFGRDVRDVMRSPYYQQVFPGAKLKRGSQAQDRLETEAGGKAHFVGVGAGLTGKGADLLVIDDPIKDEQEARSRATKDSLWRWYTQVALSRVMGKGGAVVVTMTRWAEDDLIGRLTNPDLGYTTQEEADKWTVINIPAEAEIDDPLGREVGEILWPERTPEAFLKSFRALDPAGYAALYMGRPAPPEGNFFLRDHIQGYMPHELPKNLRFYSASDHAISLEQRRDSTCMGAVGVDEDDNIWIMPDLVWAQLSADDQVEAMLQLMAQYKPLAWWAEKGHISKSIGPFLRKRMLEEQVFCSIIEKTPAVDKQTRAQSIQGRMSMGKVFFPKFAPWYADAVDQLLNFPNGAHDDFVDFLAWIGIGLALHSKPSAPRKEKKPPRTGSLDWILKQSEQKRSANRDLDIEKRYLH